MYFLSRRPNQVRFGLFVLFIASSMVISCGSASGVSSPTRAQAISSSPHSVTYENLYELEAFWPYRVELVDDWRPPGWKGRFGWGVGVLVRVEPKGLLRVDFGQSGKYMVPARETNVIEEANRIRLRTLAKLRPNFIVATGTRLLDPASNPIGPLSGRRLDETQVFLVVIADPISPDFGAIVSTLMAIRAHSGVLPILFPQGRHRDGSVLNVCRTAGWVDPILLDRFVAPLTNSILGKAPERPWLMLISPEGRVIQSVPWENGVEERLRVAIDRETCVPDGSSACPL